MKISLPGFASVRTSTLARGRELGFDVFVAVDGRAVRFAARETRFDADRYDRLRAFKVTKVFIRDEDEPSYRAYLDAIFQEAETDDKMPLDDRSQIMGSRAETVAAVFKEKPESKEAYLESTDVFGKLGRFLSNYEESAAKILRQAGTRPSDYEFHGLQVGTLSLRVAQAAGLVKSRDQVTPLLTAGFFHDLGAERLGFGLADTDETHGARRAEWEKHPDLSIEHLQGKNYVDPLVIKLIAQHEETLNGSGFPRKPSAKELDPLALVLSLCNRFDHYATRHEGRIGEALKAFLPDQVGRYDLDHIKLIEKTFQGLGSP